MRPDDQRPVGKMKFLQELRLAVHCDLCTTKTTTFWMDADGYGWMLCEAHAQEYVNAEADTQR